MRTVTLKILKEDILKGSYMNSRICPITKALNRAGFSHLRDTGRGIQNDSSNYVTTIENEDYKEIANKVCNMDNWVENGEIKCSVPPEDFEHTLTLNID